MSDDFNIKLGIIPATILIVAAGLVLLSPAISLCFLAYHSLLTAELVKYILVLSIGIPPLIGLGLTIAGLIIYLGFCVIVKLGNWLDI